VGGTLVPVGSKSLGQLQCADNDHRDRACPKTVKYNGNENMDRTCPKTVDGICGDDMDQTRPKTVDFDDEFLPSSGCEMLAGGEGIMAATLPCAAERSVGRVVEQVSWATVETDIAVGREIARTTGFAGCKLQFVDDHNLADHAICSRLPGVPACTVSDAVDAVAGAETGNNSWPDPFSLNACQNNDQRLQTEGFVPETGTCAEGGYSSCVFKSCSGVVDLPFNQDYCSNAHLSGIGNSAVVVGAESSGVNSLSGPQSRVVSSSGIADLDRHGDRTIGDTSTFVEPVVVDSTGCVAEVSFDRQTRVGVLNGVADSSTHVGPSYDDASRVENPQQAVADSTAGDGVASEPTCTPNGRLGSDALSKPHPAIDWGPGFERVVDGIFVPSTCNVVVDIPGSSSLGESVTLNAGLPNNVDIVPSDRFSIENIGKAQAVDHSIITLTKLLQTFPEQPPWDTVVNQGEEVRRLWLQYQSLVVNNGVLYRRFHATDGTTKYLQVVIPASMRK